MSNYTMWTERLGAAVTALLLLGLPLAAIGFVSPSI